MATIMVKAHPKQGERVALWGWLLAILCSLLPSLTAKDAADRGFAHAQLARQLCPGCALARVTLTEALHLFVGQLSTSMSLTATASMRGATVLLDHVLNVLLSGGKKQMIWATARPGIASMGNIVPVRNGLPVTQLPDYSVGSPSPAVHMDLAISTRIGRTQPKPAHAALVNFRPEARNIAWGILRVHRKSFPFDVAPSAV